MKKFSLWSDTKWQKNKIKNKIRFYFDDLYFSQHSFTFQNLYTRKHPSHHHYHWSFSSSASIKLVDPQDVSVGHSLPLSDCHCRIRNGSDGFQPGLDGEGCSSIVHDGAVVIWSVLVVGVLFLEVVGHIRRHVLLVDLDILVTIAPGLLVVEEVLVKLCKGVWILVD